MGWIWSKRTALWQRRTAVRLYMGKPLSTNWYISCMDWWYSSFLQSYQPYGFKDIVLVVIPELEHEDKNRTVYFTKSKIISYG